MWIAKNKMFVECSGIDLTKQITPFSLKANIEMRVLFLTTTLVKKMLKRSIADLICYVQNGIFGVRN